MKLDADGQIEELSINEVLAARNLWHDIAEDKAAPPNSPNFEATRQNTEATLDKAITALMNAVARVELQGNVIDRNKEQPIGLFAQLLNGSGINIKQFILSFMNVNNWITSLPEKTQAATLGQLQDMMNKWKFKRNVAGNNILKALYEEGSMQAAANNIGSKIDISGKLAGVKNYLNSGNVVQAKIMMDGFINELENGVASLMGTANSKTDAMVSFTPQTQTYLTCIQILLNSPALPNEPVDSDLRAELTENHLFAVLDQVTIMTRVKPLQRQLEKKMKAFEETQKLEKQVTGLMDTIRKKIADENTKIQNLRQANPADIDVQVNMIMNELNSLNGELSNLQVQFNQLKDQSKKAVEEIKLIQFNINQVMASLK